MSKSHKERDQVYAVLRWDAFQAPDSTPEVQVTVKEVVRSRELAEAEVVRLNALNEGKQVRYWWQRTRFFPEGKSAGS